MNMKTMSSILVVLAIGMVPASLLADDAPSGSLSSAPPPAQGGVQSYRHASTAAEGFLRGWADVYRAQGEYNYNTAAASLIFEQARRAHLDNKLHYAEVFWAKKQLYASNQAELKRLQLQNSIEAQPAAQVAAVPVVVQLVDPSQPGFAWPQAFNRPELIRSREQLAVLFSQRTQLDSGRGSENHWLIRNATLAARATLAHMVKELPPPEYIEAKQFLDRVMFTAEQPAEAKVATN
jgi:hypothetical protein